jgi:glutamyl-tRNA reductase
MSTSDETDGEPPTPGSTEEAIDRIDARANALRDEHVARALSRIDERGDLTPKKRVVVAALADRVTTKLVDPPKTGLRTAADSEEKRATEVALELFGD